MSNEQQSPWASGEGFGTPRPQPSHPAEPSGWSQPQQFGDLAPQPRYPSPEAAYTFGQRVPYQVPGELPEHPQATLTLVLGIVGIAALFVAFPFISPVAWYLGARARREMRSDPGRYRPSGALSAGYVLGIVGTLLAVAFVGLIVIGIALAITLAG